ncbi:Transcriptional regulatory protein sin3 [Amphichorda felina]
MNSQHPHGGSGPAPYDRDREMEERHRALQQHEEMARRDHERERERERDRDRDRERESNERFQSTPHHSSSAGSIPIHQPVASRTANAIHSPGGILGNYNGNAPNVPLGGGGGGGGGAPPGSVASFGGPLQQSEQHGRQGQHGGQGNAGAQHQMFAPMPHSQGPAAGSQSATGPSAAAAAVFGGALQQQQQQQSQQQQDGRGGQQGGPPFRGMTPGGHQIPGGITQGQQPILNVSGLSLPDFLPSEDRFRFPSEWFVLRPHMFTSKL